MNWQHRLNKAAREERFSKMDKERASKWRTCAACGFKLVPGLAGPYPEDVKIYDLGIAFSKAVNKDNIIEAQRIYDELQTFNT